eukprot:1002891-Prymnesium_polylepis.1
MGAQDSGITLTEGSGASVRPLDLRARLPPGTKRMGSAARAPPSRHQAHGFGCARASLTCARASSMGSAARPPHLRARLKRGFGCAPSLPAR